MKKVTLGLLGVATALLFVFHAHATQAPFTHEEDQRFLKLERANVLNQTGVVHIAKDRFKIDNSTNLGAVGAHTLTTTLPAKSTIIRSWIYNVTSSTGASNSTLAFSCGNANNIKTATDLHAQTADTYVEGESTGAASAFSANIASKCTITATIATGVMSTGDFDIYAEYITHD